MGKIFRALASFLGFSSAEPSLEERLTMAMNEIGSQKRLDACAQTAFQVVQRKDALASERPHPYEATIVGDCIKVDTLLTEHHSKLLSQSYGEAHYLATLLSNGIQAELQPASAASVGATISSQIAVSDPEAQRLSRELDETRHDLEVFKGANALTRPANYPASRSNSLYWIGAVAILEAIANAWFLREQSQPGVALIIAVAIAALNVGASVWFGVRYREKNFPDEVRSRHGRRYMPFAILFILALNLGVAGYRLIMQSQSAELTTQFIFESTVLLLIGVVLGITAFNKGYAIDDPFPGFGDLARKLKALEERWGLLIQKHAEFCEQQKSRALDAHQSLIQRLAGSGQNLALHLPEMARMIKTWDDGRNQLKYVHTQLLTMFRTTLVANHPNGDNYPKNLPLLNPNSQLESYKTQVNDFLSRRDSLKEELQKLITRVEQSQRALEEWISGEDARALWRWPT